MWNSKASSLLSLLLILVHLFVCASQSDYDLSIEGCLGDYMQIQVKSRFSTCNDNLRYSIDPDGDGLPDSLVLDPVTGVMSGVLRVDWSLYGYLGSRQLQTGQTYNPTVVVMNADDNSLVDEVQLDIYRAECPKKLPVVSHFMIVDTKRNEDVRPLMDGEELYLSWLWDRFSIRAVVFPDRREESFYEDWLVDKVRFVLDGKRVRTEKFAPYSLGGDTTGDNNWGDFKAFDISEGEHKLTAVPYDMAGESGPATTVKFKIAKCDPELHHGRCE